MDVSAYEYYLKGRSYYQTSKPDDLNFAEMMYLKSLEIDPNLSLAHAGLSDLYTFQYMFYYDRRPEKIEAAKQEALLALKASPRLAEGYRSLGRYYQVVGQVGEAERNLKKAIDCNPKFALAYRSMAWLYENHGDHDESMRWAKRTLELAPLDLETLVLVGRLYMDTRKYTAAVSTLQRAIELGPDYGRAHYELGSVYQKIGAFDEALKSYLTASKFKGDPNSLIQMAYLSIVKQDFVRASESLLASLREDAFPFAANYYLGLAADLQGDRKSALNYYNQTISFHAASTDSEETDPHVESYRAMAMAAAGRTEDAQREIAMIVATPDLDGELLHNIARTFALLKRPDQAKLYARMATSAHAGPTIVELQCDPHFAGISDLASELSQAS
jgi:tetratricopeptide (TPR) repeat protein